MSRFYGRAEKQGITLEYTILKREAMDGDVKA